MPTAEKAKVIEQAKEWYAKSSGIVFTENNGLKVKEFQQLRRDLRAKGAEIHVLKNTLFRLAAPDIVDGLPMELHNGPTAVAFVFENESACAKALVDFSLTHKNLVIKGGFFSGKAMSQKEVESLSKLPPRDVLIAQVIGAIAAPLTHLVSVIEALYADPIRTIGAVADKVAEGAPTPAAKVEAAPVEEPAAVAEEAAPEAATEEPAVEAESAAEEAQPEEPSTAEAPEAEAPSEAPAEGGE